jgi:hypothetical protein
MKHLLLLVALLTINIGYSQKRTYTLKELLPLDSLTGTSCTKV